MKTCFSFVENQTPHLDTLPAFGILGSVWVDKGRVWCQSCHSLATVWLTLTLRIETFDEHGFLWGHVLHVPQLMLWVWGDGVGLALQGVHMLVRGGPYTSSVLEWCVPDLPRTS